MIRPYLSDIINNNKTKSINVISSKDSDETHSMHKKAMMYKL